MRMIPRTVLWFVLSQLWACPSFAQAFIETRPGLLDDEDFFGMVVCGVMPGETCKDEPVRWAMEDRKQVTLRLRSLEAESDRMQRIRAGLHRAMTELNACCANLRLGWADQQAAEADIEIYASALHAGQTITGTQSPLDGTDIEGAAVFVQWNVTRRIKSAVIIFAADLSDEELPSVILEELTQALGPINDIRNPAYEGVSIFSEDSNAQVTLGKQDVMVLRRLYGGAGN